jgi:hypothetical protein
MKAFAYKLFIGTIVILLMNLIQTVVAFAGPASAAYYGIAYVEGVHNVANINNQYWVAKLWSKTKNPVTTMDDIGYSWWTVRERCNGNITRQVQPSPHVLHGTSSYYASSQMTKQSCNGDRQGSSMANHDFYKWPKSHMYLYADEAKFLP